MQENAKSEMNKVVSFPYAPLLPDVEPSIAFTPLPTKVRSRKEEALQDTTSTTFLQKSL